MRTGSIYIIKNSINDKVYIGQTTMTVHERFMVHMKPSTARVKRNYKLYNAVLKYGRDKFYVETLEENIPLQQLNEKEIQYIAEYDSFNCGYNSSKGGDGRIINIINDEELLLSLANNNVPAKDIAQRLNVSVATVLRTLHKLGFTYYSKITKAELLKQLKLNKTNNEIAEYFGVHPFTVTRYLDTYGLNKYNKKLPYRSDFDLDGLIRDYDNQMSISDICKKYNVTNTTFYRIKKANNLKSRPQIYKNKIRYYL